MKQRLFITATGTGTGKSFITAALVQQARALGRSVAAYKPVISGFDPAQAADSDTGLLLQSLGQPLTPDNIARVSPWRFTAPLAPSMAARFDQRSLDFDALVAHGHGTLNSDEDLVLIEGVGGVMVPLTEKQTVVDWIAALGCEAVLVTGTYLGAISHTLTALEVLRQRHIPVFAVIVNDSEESSVPLAATVDELSRWTRLPIVAVARRRASDWRSVNELRPLIAARVAA